MRVIYLQDVRRMLREAPEELEELLCQGTGERTFTPTAARYLAEDFVARRDRYFREHPNGPWPPPSGEPEAG